MPKNISTIKINSTLEKVWDTITKPEYVKLWQFGSDLSNNWEVGSSIKFKTQWEDKVFEQWGTVLEFKPYNLVKYNLFAPKPDLENKLENYFIMSYALTEENEQIKLEIIQDDNRPNAVQEDPQGEENQILQVLKKVSENSLL